MQVKLVSIVILIHIVGGIKIKVEESNVEILSWSDTRC